MPSWLPAIAGIPARPSFMDPDNARSDGLYNPVQHHPAARCDRLILKQVAGKPRVIVRPAISAMAEGD